MSKADFPFYLTQYLSQYLPLQKNVSENTIASYRDAFKLFLTFCEQERKLKPEKLSIKHLDKKLILDWLNWLETERSCSASTRNHRLSVIHAFCRYVQKEAPEHLYDLQKIFSIPSKKHPKPLVPYLTGDEMKFLLAQPDRSTKAGFRDSVLLAALYDTAARVQELADIRHSDIRFSKPSVVTLHGKGDKVRQIPIMSNTRCLLEQYMELSKVPFGMDAGERYLFVNQRKQKLSRWGISYVINKYVALAEKDPSFSVPFPITPHVFRHSKAMHLIQSGVNLIYIRDFLGHVDCSTTEVYARADSEMKRKAIEAAYIDFIPEGLPRWEDDGDLMQWLSSLCE